MTRPPWRSALAAAALALGMGLLGGCRAAAPPETEEAAPENPLYVSPADHDFSRNPALLERIVARPFGYFRFINSTFTSAVCERFADNLASLPYVNLHGDAHLEQYAVTRRGRGLSDFDDSASGPPLVDLLRFAVSVELALEARGWTDRRDEMRRSFLDGYLAALEDPELPVSEPSVVARIRSGFSRDHETFLAWADSLMQPLPANLALETSKTLVQQKMAASHPELPATHFVIKAMGALEMGIGSALDEKYLLRMEGPSPADDDDVIVEAKEVRDLRSIDCIQRRPNDPFPILVAQSRIAYQPNPFLGFLHFTPRKARDSPLGTDFWDGKTFWFFSWQDNYQELDIDTSLTSADELAEVVHDVGVQLGKGHPAAIASPLDRQLRLALLEMPKLYRDDVIRAMDELTAQTVAAWERFRREVRVE